jgi:hypothetical protein
MPSAKALPATFRLKITLVGIEPPIWRRVQVPSTINLRCFHSALQVVMGWKDSHLHKFEKDGERWGVPDDCDLIDEGKTTLSKVLNVEGDSMVYQYDFGDNWRHHVVLEKIFPAEGAANRPVCLGGERHCPPEDVGGVSGYQEFLEVIFDPKHEEYEDLIAWAGGPFQAEEFDLSAVNKMLSCVTIGL